MVNEEKILEALEKMQSQMDSMQSQMNGMQSQMNGMQSQIDGMQVQMDTRFEKLEGDIHAVRSDITSVKSDVQAVRLLVDVDIERKLNLLADGHQTLLETLAPKSRVEALEEDVSTLKTVIRLLAEKVDALGAAG